MYLLNIKRRWNLYIILITLLLAACIIAVRWRDYGNLNIKHNTLKQRLYNLYESVNIIKDNPILGTGIGTFREASYKYKNSQHNESKYVHNMYLQIWNELGIAPFTVTILLVIKLLAGLKKTRNIYYITLIACLIFNFFEYGYYFTEIIVLTVLLYLISKNTKDVVSGGVSSNRKIFKYRINVKFLNIALIFVCIIIFYFNNMYMNNKIHLKRAVNYYDENDIRNALKEISISIAYYPYNKTSFDIKSKILYKKYLTTKDKSYLKSAINSIKTAIKLSPHQPYYYKKLLYFRGRL